MLPPRLQTGLGSFLPLPASGAHHPTLRHCRHRTSSPLSLFSGVCLTSLLEDTCHWIQGPPGNPGQVSRPKILSHIFKDPSSSEVPFPGPSVRCRLGLLEAPVQPTVPGDLPSFPDAACGCADKPWVRFLGELLRAGG